MNQIDQKATLTFACFDCHVFIVRAIVIDGRSTVICPACGKNHVVELYIREDRNADKPESETVPRQGD
jgi:hypothetical protein